VHRGREIEVPFFSKAPFANYDLVVYLGGGLFAVLIFWRYVARPFSIFDFSSLVSNGTSTWVQDVIYLVLLGVCSYVLGHLVSYQSSYFIEGFVERTLGKFSKIVEINTAHESKRLRSLKSEIRSNLKTRLLMWFRIPLTRLRVPVPKIFPTIIHLPMLPWYALVYFFGFFDFADTRLPARMLDRAKQLMKSELTDFDFDENKQWFRWIEYYTSYNRPVAASSMYNYLTISGLMRSLSYLFLVSIWLEFAYLIAKLTYNFDRVSHGAGNAVGWLLYFFVLYTAYITTATSYCKFFRRYVEEAIMGFLLEGSHSRS
jgi:hypothetical protein